MEGVFQQQVYFFWTQIFICHHMVKVVVTMTRHLAVPLRLSARCLSKGASTALSNFKTESPPVTQQDSTPLWGQLEKLFSSSNLCTILHEALWTYKDSICFIEWITSPLQCKIVLGQPSYFWRVLQRVVQFWCMSSAWKTKNDSILDSILECINGIKQAGKPRRCASPST